MHPFLYILKSNTSVRPEYLQEDDFKKNLLSNGVGALILAPILLLILWLNDFPSLSLWSTLSYIAMFPVYAFLCGYNIKLRNKLIYFLIIHLYFWSAINMYPLVDADVSVKEVIVAIISYIISLIIIQRFVYAVIYQVLVLGFLFYITTRNGESSFLHAIGLTMVALIGGANTLMMASRRAIISSLERYSSYLKNLLNSTGRGFVLFQWSDGWKIYDYNEETNNFLRSEAGHFDVRFFELFSEAEMEKIRKLREAGKFEKTVSFTNDMDGSIQHVAIEVSRIQFEQTDSLLAVITDVTEAYMRQRELLAREKRYRNLYDKNRAGVFTLDRNSVILDANSSFFSMFENSIDRGERLFDWEFKNEWKFILSSIEDNHQGQNYQTTYRLKNGNMKTFVFNWYQEASTGSIEGSVVDLTDTQRAAQALKQSEEKYRSIYEGSSDAIVLLDKDIIVEYNRSAQQLFGIQDLKNSSLFNLSGDLSIENSRKYDREKEGLKSRKWIRFNWIFKSEKGEVETELSFQEIVIDGKLLYQCIIHDLTEQNRLVKEEIRARLAEETNIQLESEIQERRRAEKQLKEQFLRTKAILDSSSNTFLLTLNKERRITGFNSHSSSYFKMLFGIEITENMLFNTLFDEVLSKRRYRLFTIYLGRIMRGASHQMEVKLRSKNGNEYWMEIFMNPIFDDEGSVAEISLVAHDISEKKKSSIEIVESLKEKEVLLKEIHHRVKNNLQIISSILNLQSAFVTDENTLGILHESRNRIRSMAIIHETLYKSDVFSSVDFGKYIEDLCQNLIASYQISGNVKLELEVQPVHMILDQAIPCGLLINEIITNSLKYAWPDHQKGSIWVRLSQEGQNVVLEVSDDGQGLPEQFDKMNTETLGLQLIATLNEQLEGKLEVSNQNGTKYLLKFDNIRR
jgi:PAS domain S-box-containing protein